MPTTRRIRILRKHRWLMHLVIWHRRWKERKEDDDSIFTDMLIESKTAPRPLDSHFMEKDEDALVRIRGFVNPRSQPTDNNGGYGGLYAREGWSAE